MLKEKKIFNKIFICIIFISINFSVFSDENYYLTRRNDKVNLRQGPSFQYPVKFVYEKKFLPLLIKDKSENFRKILDHEDNSGWIHISQLSKKRSGINIKKNSILYKKSTIYSKPLAKLEVGRLVLINKCNVKWCKIKSGNFDGWIDKKSLWGKVK